MIFRRRVPRSPLIESRATIDPTGDHLTMTLTLRASAADPPELPPMHTRQLPTLIGPQGPVALDFATADWIVNRRADAAPTPRDDTVPRGTATLNLRYRLRERQTTGTQLRASLPRNAIAPLEGDFQTPAIDTAVMNNSRVDAEGWFVAPPAEHTIRLDPRGPINTLAAALAALAARSDASATLLVRRSIDGTPCHFEIDGDLRLTRAGTTHAPFVLGTFGDASDEHVRPIVTCHAVQIEASHVLIEGLEFCRHPKAEPLAVTIRAVPGTVGVTMQDCLIRGMGNIGPHTIDRCIIVDTPVDANTFAMGNEGTARKAIVDTRRSSISDCHCIGTGPQLREDPGRRGHGCYATGDGRVDADPSSPPVRGVQAVYRGNIFLNAGRQNMFRLRAAGAALSIHHCLQVGGGSGVVCGVDVGQGPGTPEALAGRSSNITMRFCVNLESGRESTDSFSKALGDFRDVRGVWITDCLATQAPRMTNPALRVGIDGQSIDTTPTLQDVWIERVSMPACGATGALLGGATGRGVLRRCAIGTTTWHARNTIGAVVLASTTWRLDGNAYAGPSYPREGPGSPYDTPTEGAALVAALATGIEPMELSRWRAVSGQDRGSVSLPAGVPLTSRPDVAEFEAIRPRAAWESPGMTLAEALASRPRRAWCDELSGWAIVRWMLQRWSAPGRELQ